MSGVYVCCYLCWVWVVCKKLGVDKDMELDLYDFKGWVVVEYEVGCWLGVRV